MYLLTASQITQIEFSPEEHTAFVGGVALNQNLKNGVRATGVDIRSGLPCAPVSLASLQQNKAVVGIGDHVLALPLHKNTSVLVLPDVEGPVWIAILEQIKELLVVNLQKRAIDRVSDIALILNLIQPLKQSLYGPGYNTKLQVILQEGIHLAIVVHLPYTLLDNCVLTRHALIVIPVRPKHREGLSWACLPVRKYRRVESIEDIVDVRCE